MSAAQISVVVDVEEGFNWEKPFSSASTDVSAIDHLYKIEDIFIKYDVIPVYMLTYPIVNSEKGRRILGELLGKQRCVLGAQLHPWVNPPLEEKITGNNSYVKNLSVDLEERKIQKLLRKIHSTFGYKASIYKAGRYGVDLSRTDMLLANGIKIDNSIMPHANFRHRDNGPDFFGLPEEPFWLDPDKGLLSVPSTQALVGHLSSSLAPCLTRKIYSPRGERFFIPAILSKCGLLERIRLSPEGHSLQDLKRLIDDRLRVGAKHLCLSFHSPSLAPGFTPYVRSDSDVVAFLSVLEGALRYAIVDRGATPVSLDQFYRQKLGELDEEKKTRRNAKEPSITAGHKRPLRILFISGFLPPYSPVGAVRTHKLLRYWRNQGIDVRTIAIDVGSQVPENFAASTGDFYLKYTEPGERLDPFINNVRALWSLLSRPRANSAGQKNPDKIKNAEKEPESSLKRLYREALFFPDRYRNWINPVCALTMSWAANWKPDLIYSSGPPHSGHVAAERLARQLNLPWIAELRDVWAADPYYGRHPIVEPFHDTYAKRILSKADACVAVTRRASFEVMGLTGKKTIVSYNGFDMDDFEGLEDAEPYDPQCLTILHAGVIYPGRRDPTPLFAAMASLGDDKKGIRCLFFHDAHNEIGALAEGFGVEGCIEIYDSVPREEILRLERSVDILLELRWYDKAGDGVIPGKLFEYIGARRRILSIGSLSGEAAQIIRENGLGLTSNNPEEIAAMLKECLAIKKRSPRLPDTAKEPTLRFRRDLQFRKIDSLIEGVLANGVE